MTALEYAARGWPIFPVGRNKVPRVKWGEAATTDPAQIETWWRQWPDALIGMKTGRASGLIVLDVDVKDPAAYGFDTLADLGLAILPNTPLAHTPSGGLHIYFAVNPQVEIRDSVGKHGLGPGLDVRGDGGYVRLPSSGSGYWWDPHWNFDTVAPVLAPAWLGHKTKPERLRHPGGPLDPGAMLEAACRAIREAQPGERHEVLNRETFSIGTLVAAGALDETVAYRQLAAAAAALASRTGGNFQKTERDLRDAFGAGLVAPRGGRK